MATVTWDSFFAITAPNLPGCPDIAIRSALAASAAEFCGRARVWRVITGSDTTFSGERDYTLGIPSQTVLEKVISLTLGGRVLKQVNPASESPDAASKSGRPTEFAQIDESAVRFFDVPDGEYTFEATCVIRPSRDATGVDQFLYEWYSEPIASGAIYRIAMIPGKDWTSPEMAAFHKSLFETEVARALARDLSKAVPRLTPHFF